MSLQRATSVVESVLAGTPAEAGISNGSFTAATNMSCTPWREWVRPGTPGLEHRIGGLEKDFTTGNVSYDADNHEKMTQVRAAKVAGIAKDIPKQEVNGEKSGDLLVVGVGGTYGALTQAVDQCRARGLPVSSIHLRHLNPFPSNLGGIIGSFKKVLVCELNNGQLIKVLRRPPRRRAGAKQDPGQAVQGLGGRRRDRGGAPSRRPHAVSEVRA